jgi:hypothetical protein
MKFLIAAILLLPVLAQAANIPDPKVGSSICYEGVNSAKVIDKRLNKINVKLTRYKEFPETLYASIAVVTQKGNKYDNGGTVTGDKTVPDVDARMDCDGGGFKLTPDAKNANKVSLTIEGLSLVSRSAECGDMYIDNKNPAQSITLTRSAKCKHEEPNL